MRTRNRNRRCFICGSTHSCEHRENRIDPARYVLINLIETLFAREHKQAEEANGGEWVCVCGSCVKCRRLLAKEKSH
jgi:hypothetical protein